MANNEIAVELKVNEKKAIKSVSNFEKQLNSTEKQFINLNKNTKVYNKESKTARSNTDSFSNSLRNSSKSLKLAGVGVGLLVAGLTTLGALSVKTGKDLEVNFKNINSILQLSDKEFKKLKQSVFDLNQSQGFLNSNQDLTASLYNIVSASFETKDAIKVLGTVSRGSSAGLADMSATADLLTTALNANKLSAADSEQIMNQFLETVARGKTTLPELASNLGSVFSTSSQVLGETRDSIAQVNGSLAVLTKNGINTAESSTGLTAALSSFLKPAEQSVQIANKLGLAWDSNTVKTKGLIPFLTEVKEKIDKYKNAPEIIAGLFPNIRAMKTMSVLINNLEDVEKQYKAIGQASETTNKQLAQNTDTLQSSLNSLKYSTEQLGQKFYDVFRDDMKNAVDWATGYLNVLQDNLLTLKNTGSQVFSFLTGGIPGLLSTRKEQSNAAKNKAEKDKNLVLLNQTIRAVENGEKIKKEDLKTSIKVLQTLGLTNDNRKLQNDLLIAELQTLEKINKEKLKGTGGVTGNNGTKATLNKPSFDFSSLTTSTKTTQEKKRDLDAELNAWLDANEERQNVIDQMQDSFKSGVNSYIEGEEKKLNAWLEANETKQGIIDAQQSSFESGVNKYNQSLARVRNGLANITGDLGELFGLSGDLTFNLVNNFDSIKESLTAFNKDGLEGITNFVNAGGDITGIIDLIRFGIQETANYLKVSSTELRKLIKNDFEIAEERVKSIQNIFDSIPGLGGFGQSIRQGTESIFGLDSIDTIIAKKKREAEAEKELNRVIISLKNNEIVKINELFDLDLKRINETKQSETESLRDTLKLRADYNKDLLSLEQDLQRTKENLLDDTLDKIKNHHSKEYENKRAVIDKLISEDDRQIKALEKQLDRIDARFKRKRDSLSGDAFKSFTSDKTAFKSDNVSFEALINNPISDFELDIEKARANIEDSFIKGKITQEQRIKNLKDLTIEASVFYETLASQQESESRIQAELQFKNYEAYEEYRDLVSQSLDIQQEKDSRNTVQELENLRLTQEQRQNDLTNLELNYKAKIDSINQAWKNSSEVHKIAMLESIGVWSNHAQTQLKVINQAASNVKKQIADNNKILDSQTRKIAENKSKLSASKMSANKSNGFNLGGFLGDTLKTITGYSAVENIANTLSGNNLDKSRIGMYAKGGLITSPTNAIMGENYKPEMVINQAQMSQLFRIANGQDVVRNGASNKVNIVINNPSFDTKSNSQRVINQLSKEVKRIVSN